MKTGDRLLEKEKRMLRIFVNREEEMQTPGDCMNCTIHGYHSPLLPERIRTEKQKRWDRVLTVACNTCDGYSNYHDKNRFVLDDAFVETLRIKMHIVLEDEIYEGFAAS